MLKPKLLFVDDEKYFSTRYLEALAENFEVEHRAGAGEALQYLKHEGLPAAMVLDIMMPTPQGVPESETNHGLDTGIWLLKELKSIWNPWRLPVFILTNRRLDSVRERLAGLALPEAYLRLNAKVETPAFYLTGAVQALIDETSLRERG